MTDRPYQLRIAQALEELVGILKPALGTRKNPIRQPRSQELCRRKGEHVWRWFEDVLGKYRQCATCFKSENAEDVAEDV